MKNLIATVFFFASGNLLAQAVPKSPKLPGKVFSQEPIVITNPSREKPVLVLFENHRTFAKDVKTVTDTLSPIHTYRVLTNADSIKRYSDSKFVRQLVIISRKLKK